MAYKKNKNSAQSADQSAQQNNADRSGVSKRVGKQKNTADKLTETVKNTVKTPKKKNVTKKAYSHFLPVSGLDSMLVILIPFRFIWLNIL